MKPQPQNRFTTPWHRKFAWRPVRARNGKWLWLRTVIEREIHVSVNTISVTKYVKEYDTPVGVLMEKLSGENP